MKHHRTIFSLIPLLSLGLLLVPQVTFAGISEDIQGVIYYFVVEFFGMFVWFGAMLLNFGINQFVIGFGDVFNNSGIGVAVNNTWVIIRDFVNLGFIFGLVYIGLRMILDSSNSNTRRWLANLIIAALLVNFSLFATKFVVDMSNKLATEIACAGLTYPTSNDPNVSPSYCKDGLYRIDAGSALMARMGLITVFSQGKDAKPDGSGWGYIFGTAILFLVAAFVFAAGGILLFIRFAVLNLYLVFSAVMFIGWVIPGIPDQMRSYWKGFLSRAFFAPLYLMMLYFSFKIIDGLQQSIRTQGDGTTGTDFSNPNWQQTLSKNPADNPADATLGTLPFFVLICIFLIASLVIAQKLGADGAGKAVSIGKKIGNKVTNSTVNATKRAAGGATLGLAARGLQGTVGLGANQLSNNRRFQKLAANNKLARGALRATRGIADSSFDARKVGGLGKELGIGEGIKGGYNTREKNKLKRDEEFLKSLTPLSDGELESPEVKGRVDALAEEKSKDAAEKKSANELGLEQIKAVEENNGKTFTQLDNEIDDLTKEINELGKVLAKKTADGTATEEYKRAAETEIAKKEAEKRTKRLASEDISKTEFVRQRARSAAYNEETAADPIVKAQYRQERERLEAELKARTDLKEREKASKKEIEKADEEIKKAKADARNEIKFENQEAYIKAKRRKFQPDGTPGSFKFNPLEEASYDNLVKKYGSNANELATKAKKNKEKKELAESIAEVQKDTGIGGDAKKDEVKDEEKSE